MGDSTHHPLVGAREEAHRWNMRAQVGDTLIAESNKVDAPSKHGEIIEVRGEGGAPPYVVRWGDGHEGLVYPGADAHVLPAGPT